VCGLCCTAKQRQAAGPGVAPAGMGWRSMVAAGSPVLHP
jgi:hypothetical protein